MRTLSGDELIAVVLHDSESWGASDLDEDEIQQVDEHLGTCVCCPPVLQALQGVVAALAKKPRTAPVEGLLDALRAEIAQALLTGP